MTKRGEGLGDAQLSTTGSLPFAGDEEDIIIGTEVMLEVRIADNKARVAHSMERSTSKACDYA